ncbi:MAG: anthranilate synthase component I family protein [Bacteroidetes bacterium]|nr:anthranilate synthase component I family protein [Bacteroidota bacterium]
MTRLEKDLHELPWGLPGLLRWASTHEVFCVFGGSAAKDLDYAFPHQLALGVARSFELGMDGSLNDLDAFLCSSEIGYVVQIGYGLKDHLEKLPSRHLDPIGFPDLYVFEPVVRIQLLGDRIHIWAPDAAAVWEQILAGRDRLSSTEIPSIDFQPRSSRAQYREALEQVLSHIRRGDCYELNYCQEFYAAGVQLDPVTVYERLCAVVQAPFASFYRNKHRWMMGASPERFLKKQGDRVESRPMKGTAPRDIHPSVDSELAQALQESPKDRSENIMVVDLVRNDLSRVSKKGTVRVEALCALHSFPQVHQLVSTVSGQLRSGTGFRNILEACFPMGSMTGAPKVRVMELTDRYEYSARGLYSGSVGYLEPNGDFDLNVVIRSLQYNASSGYLSYHVGSGITAYSDPEKEWEECLWKSRGIREALKKESDEP